MKKYIVIGCIMLLSLLIFGCQSNTYIASDIHPNFPIPERAEKIESAAKNENIIAYAKYKYAKADEIRSIDLEYLQTIKSWGWSELPDEQMGALRVFEKDGQKLTIVTNDGTFALAIWKK